MWIALQFGFFSIVCKGDNSFHIRGRLKGDLENLLQFTDLDYPIEDWPQADYHFRIIVPQEDLLEIMNRLGKTVDYPNFKDRIGSRPNQRLKLHAYHNFWAELRILQT